jgi:hypothetical protein
LRGIRPVKLGLDRADIVNRWFDERQALVKPAPETSESIVHHVRKTTREPRKG